MTYETRKFPDPAQLPPRLWTVDEYQAWVGTICQTPQACSVAGLAGEAGEVAELIGTQASLLQRAAARVVDTLKKFIWHARPFDRTKLVKELGDTYWYLADLARQNGIPMSEVQGANVEKLMARFPKGYFTPEDSNARADERPYQFTQLPELWRLEALGDEAAKAELKTRDAAYSALGQG